MKKIYDKEAVCKAISNSCYKDVLEQLDIPMFLCEYSKGELVSAPDHKNDLFQIIVSGSISIYFIRNDGSSYHLAFSDSGTILGETDLFGADNKGVFAESSGDLTCIAFSISDNKEALLNNNCFLRMLTESLVKKMELITIQDAIPSSLEERVLSYMNYICSDRTLKGLEKAAFQLHCSPRQLQRVLNKLGEDGRVRKTGKGTYVLV